MLKGPHSDGGWKVKTAFFFAGTGTIAVAIGWFLLPEVARRSPAEIDEMFAKKVPSRKFKGYVTEVERNLDAKEASDAAISEK
jgi:SP family general alpha glucoside:H+ symporter-like MFS transporter